MYLILFPVLNRRICPRYHRFVFFSFKCEVIGQFSEQSVFHFGAAADRIEKRTRTYAATIQFFDVDDLDIISRFFRVFPLRGGYHGFSGFDMTSRHLPSLTFGIVDHQKTIVPESHGIYGAHLSPSRKLSFDAHSRTVRDSRIPISRNLFRRVSSLKI